MQKAVSDEVDLAESCPTFAASSKGFYAEETSASGWLPACLLGSSGESQPWLPNNLSIG